MKKKKKKLTHRVLDTLIVLVMVAMVVAAVLLFLPVHKPFAVSLAKLLRFQKQVSIDIENAKTIPDTYHSIDKTIQEVVKKAYEK